MKLANAKIEYPGGTIITDRQVTDECLAVTIGGYGNADRIAEDKDHDLALLRIYGARGLKPLTLSNGAAKSGVGEPISGAGPNQITWFFGK